MADSDTTQKVTFDSLFAQVKDLLELMQTNRASREAEKSAIAEKREAEKSAIAEKREAEKRAIAEKREANKKVFAQVKALLELMQANRASREAEDKAIIANNQRINGPCEAKAIIANNQRAETEAIAGTPFLTTPQWLSIICLIMLCNY